MSSLKILIVIIFGYGFACLSSTSLMGEFIFTPDSVKHGHTHASGIVECPNGDLLACWYEGKTDRSEDVHIQAARLPKGSRQWSESFLLADTPMLSDNNPCMIIDGQKRLWLFYYTLLGSPQEAWETALLRFKISSHYQDTTKPIVWDVEKDLHVQPNGLDEIVTALCQDPSIDFGSEGEAVCETARSKLKSQLVRRLGWTTRVHPIILASGSLVLPMASEIFGVAAMAMTSDEGKTWTFSQSPYGYGVEQPSVIQRKDGSLVTFFRDSSPAHRIRFSESKDGGFSWTAIQNTDLLNPGSGLEALRLKSGRVILIYNDVEDDPRSSLAVSTSEDEGRTWKWTRHIERDRQGRYDYPSVIQARDGWIHVTFSFNVRTIKHAKFTEAWVQEGD